MLSAFIRSIPILALAAATGAWAQAYPTKPVTMIVPFAAGGPTDTVARTIGVAMQGILKQTVLVENVGGAGGTLGVARVARATPDGYTILLYHIGMSTAPALYRKLPFDPLKDFEYIGLVNEVPMTLIGRPTLQANTFKELLPWIKANGNKVNYGNAGLGAEPVSMDKATPEYLQKFLAAEIAKWGPIIKKAGQYAD
jgi:tripartite-type tricarboxylate transporter receptor subunit TctC